MPILYVNDVRASISHYCEVLGFRQDWVSGGLAQVSRDGFGIMFRQQEGSQTQEVWIGVEELDSLYHKEIQEKAADSLNFSRSVAGDRA
jgi:catechol 2,3-dioxygenase-like lactoylglutathione lyase family enzyme